MEQFQSQAESFLYFVPDKLALENLAILHTRSVNFVAANPQDWPWQTKGLHVSQLKLRWFCISTKPETQEELYKVYKFQSQPEIVLYFGPSKLGLENLAILHIVKNNQ